MKAFIFHILTPTILLQPIFLCVGEKMKVITKIEIQKKNKNRCSVFVNEEFAFGMDLDAIITYDIQKGNQYTQKEYKELLKAMQYEKSKSAALRYVGYSPRTIRQTTEKLESLEYDAVIIDKTIEFLKLYGYLDDLQYAKDFIRSRIKQKKHGRYKIAYDLMHRGIKKCISEPLLEAYEEEEYKGALALYHKKAKGKEAKSNQEKAKITRYLQGRGYPFEIIKQVIEQDM